MPRVSSPVFVGRIEELERLSTALDAAAGGRTAVRLIGGEAGIGKSRLLQEFTRRARSADAHVLEGDCVPLGETGLAYGPFVGALRGLLRAVGPERFGELAGHGREELARLLPDLGPAPSRRSARPDASVGSTEAQSRLFEVVFGVLHRLSSDRPVALVLEDIHWADPSTRDLLRFLVRNAREEALLIIATYRFDELHRHHPLRPLVAELQRIGGVDLIELAAFRAHEVADQVEGITGRPAEPELVERLLSRSGGNPFFAEELLASGDLGLTLPGTLRDTLGDRVRRLGTDAQRVARVASVAGPRVDHATLAAVSALSADRLTEAVREAVEHQLLVPTAPEEVPGYAFRHALVQEVVYGELLPNERSELHAAYADALAHGDGGSGPGGATAAQVAHHWLLAHDVERALPATLDAARAAMTALAFPEAHAFLERVLELWPRVRPEALPTEIDRITVLSMAAESAAQAGDPRRSIDLVRAALSELDPRAEPMRSGVLQHHLAWYLNESGDWQAGVVAMERAVELIPIDPPSPERARVLADLAHSLMVRSRFGESLALAEAALAISRTVGARVAEARALHVIGLDLACRSDFERAIPLMREGHELTLALGDPVAIFLTAVGLGWALDESARHAEALEVARSTRERIRHLGADARFGGQLASKVARALHDLGRWDEAKAIMDDTIAAGTTAYAVRWLLSNRVRLHAGRGDVEAARADLELYEQLGEKVIGPDPDLMNLRRAEVAIVAGEPLLARTLVRDTLIRLAEPELDNDARLLMLVGLRAEAEEADAARSAGDRERVEEAITAARALEGDFDAYLRRLGEVAAAPAPVVEADRGWATALVRRTMGEPDVEAWEAAVAGRRTLGRPHELALVLSDLAAAALEVRNRDEGAAALIEAHAIAAELGAAPILQRLESLARRARIGLEGVDTADDAAERLGLTPREREVLALLADGRSNRQIGEQLYMAESTAGVHVSNILGKLGVTRRSEAAAVAHRLGLFGLV